MWIQYHQFLYFDRNSGKSQISQKKSDKPFRPVLSIISQKSLRPVVCPKLYLAIFSKNVWKWLNNNKFRGKKFVNNLFLVYPKTIICCDINLCRHENGYILRLTKNNFQNVHFVTKHDFITFKISSYPSRQLFPSI